MIGYIHRFLERAKGNVEKEVPVSHYDDLVNKAEIGRMASDLMKSVMWEEVIDKQIETAMEQGIGKLMRPTSLSLPESEIKATMAGMQAYLAFIANTRYLIERGTLAGKEIEALDKKRKR